MEYIGRDFADRKIVNMNPRDNGLWNYIKMAATGVAGLALVAGTVISGNEGDKEANWYRVNAPNMVVSECYAKEDTAKNWNWDRYLHEVRERNGLRNDYSAKNIMLPDTDNDREVCGKNMDAAEGR
jgi:hypothetical protein